MIVRLAILIPMLMAAGQPFAPLPATFVGVLPCADCPGIRYHLDLLADNVFHLRMTYLERPEAGDLDDIGSWALSSDGTTLILQGGPAAPDLFAIKGPRTLCKLDLEGREIDSSLPYALERAETCAVFEPHLAMRGMYSYQADAGFFTECLTGRRYPVAMEGDNAALEQAYSLARREPGEALLVNLEGRLAARPKMEGPGTQPTLVVDRFLRVWPDAECDPRFAAATLGNTTWTLTALGDQPVAAADPRRRPNLVLDDETHRLSGSGGCNRLMGGFERDGDQIHFSQVASTMMACPDGMDTEVAFTKALAQVVTWRVLGRLLDFYDTEGNRIARFEADNQK